MITASLKTDKEIVSGNFFGLPKEWLFKNFITALKVFEYQTPEGEIVKLLPTVSSSGLDYGIIINTLLYTIGGALCATIVPCFVSPDTENAIVPIISKINCIVSDIKKPPK